MLPFEERTCKARKQSGSSLVVSMIMLVVLMLMGVGAMVVSNTQLQMAGNLQFQNIALSNADSALAQAENWLVTNFENTKFGARVSGGIYPKGSTVPDPYTATWDSSNSEALDMFGTQRYMIEVLSLNQPKAEQSIKPCVPNGAVPCEYANIYRVTTRGASARGAVKIVQSVFAVRLK